MEKWEINRRKASFAEPHNNNPSGDKDVQKGIDDYNRAHGKTDEKPKPPPDDTGSYEVHQSGGTVINHDGLPK